MREPGEEWRKEVCQYNIELFGMYMNKTRDRGDRQWCREVVDKYRIELNVLNGVAGRVVYF